MRRVVIFTAEALAGAGGTVDKQVSDSQIPKSHTHAPCTADESAVTRALLDGGTPTALLRT